ncbi:MAG: hypothetical protein ACI857_002580 [Arenicella sp.]|jgi:hypothetical protein
MNLSEYFFKTTFNPNENFEALREDPNKDGLGAKAFVMSIGIQVIIRLAFSCFSFLSYGMLGGFLSSFLLSIVLSTVIMNVLLLVVIHFAINQAVDDKHADWPLVMGLVGISSLPLIIGIVLSQLIPTAGQLFSILGSVGTGVVIGIGAHILLDVKKESAMIIMPLVIVLVGFLSSFAMGFLFNFM